MDFAITRLKRCTDKMMFEHRVTFDFSNIESVKMGYNNESYIIKGVNGQSICLMIETRILTDEDFFMSDPLSQEDFNDLVEILETFLNEEPIEYLLG